SPHVEAIAYGPDGILDNAKTGALLIDMSSITPQTSIDLAKAAGAKGIRVLDAPVSGGEAGAIEAVLSIMVGGEQADFDAARPVGAALPVGAVVANLVASLRAQGDGGLDHSALLRGVERLSGHTIEG